MKFVAKNKKSYKSKRELERRKKSWKTSNVKVENLNASNPNATFAFNFTANLDPTEYARMQGSIPNLKLKRKLEDEEEFDDAE